MIPRSNQTAKLVALAGALCALLSQVAAPAQAQGALVVISNPVTRTGALYNYSYAVNYTSPDGGVTDLAYVEFTTPPNIPVSNLGASTGFFTNYDPNEGGSGFVTFLETDGSKTFSANSPVSFSFSSTYGPGMVAYDASDFSTTYTGRLIAPSVAPAPESGTLVPLGVGALGLTLLAVRRRRCTTALVS